MVTTSRGGGSLGLAKLGEDGDARTGGARRARRRARGTGGAGARGRGGGNHRGQDALVGVDAQAESTTADLGVVSCTGQVASRQTGRAGRLGRGAAEALEAGLDTGKDEAKTSARGDTRLDGGVRTAEGGHLGRERASRAGLVREAADVGPAGRQDHLTLVEQFDLRVRLGNRQGHREGGQGDLQARGPDERNGLHCYSTLMKGFKRKGKVKKV